MSFEEQFPSLNGYEYKNKNMDKDWLSGELTEEEKENAGNSNFYFNQADVETFCLDKQKVKEAIKKSLNPMEEECCCCEVDYYYCTYCQAQDLLKELGL